MREKFLDYIVDPITKESFDLRVYKKEDGHIASGILQNENSWYPIINGIPRILIGKLKSNLLRNHYSFFKTYEKSFPNNVVQEWRAEFSKIDDLNKFLDHQKKTAESFAYEWNNIYQENDFEKNNFLHFLSPFISEQDLRDKFTVDAGCGSGRFTKHAALCGTEMSFGTDLGESVELAYKLTKDLDNTCIIQADIYAMPFKNQFDIIYSIGVLHHLPKPQEGFSGLPKALKIDGKILIWVYNRRNNKRALYFYEPIRSLCKKFPKPLLYKLCYIPGGIVHGLNYLTHCCNFFGAKNLAKKMPFAYYANFPFNMKLNDAFDVLATPKSNYYYVEEIEKWFREADLKNIQSHEHSEAGITCIGTHE